MSSQPSFSSVDNKRLIWSSLVESSYFKGFPPSQKDMVKRVLDSVVHEVSQTPAMAGLSTPERNHEVVKQMVSYRDLWTQDGTIGQPPTQASTPAHSPPHFPQQHVQSSPTGYVSQVTAEELREQRESAFNKSLMEKQSEMEGYLKGSRPQNIDFSDNNQEQRIGGDMERLVAEAEAERRRQMDGLFTDGNGGQKDAEKWVNGGRPLKIDNSESLPIESQTIQQPPRRVRFSDEESPPRQRRPSSGEADIFAKLKRRPASPPGRDRSNSLERQNYESLLSEMKEMRSQLAEIGKNIERLLVIKDKSEVKRENKSEDD
jgi:hypothetical protein